MRTVEIVTASTLMLLSAWFMVLALELPIGWEAGEGPGGGAFPFWLSLGVFACAALVLIREIRAPASLKRNARVFIHRAASGQLAAALGGLTAMVVATPIVGAYVAIPAFMIAYLKVIGKTGWLVAVSLAVGTILFMFFFFEVALKILLPKGFTEPLFFPLYAMFF
jgi:hypothetical protein